MKKIILYLSALLMVGIKPVLAAVQGPSFSLESVFIMVQDILGYASTLFGMTWVQGNEAGFMKLLLWVLVFTILFAVGNLVFAKMASPGFPAKRISLIVALVLATSTALLTPNDLVVAMFSSYATLVMFVFMAAVLGAVIWLVYGNYLKAIVSGPALHVIRILGLLLCWWILATITQFADGATGVTTFQYVLPLIFINLKE